MTKIRCLKCNDIVEGDKRGTFKQCKCKACFIDETKEYYRIGGEFDQVEAEVDNKWVLLKDMKPYWEKAC